MTAAEPVSDTRGVHGFVGGCLCGAVRFGSRVDASFALHCCCVDCRKSSGTGHGTHVVVRRDEFAVTGTVTLYERAADSGNVVTRAFCGECGSPVYSTNSGKPDVVYPRASALDEPDRIRPQMILYASRAPSWDVMPAAIPAFDTLPDPSRAAPETT